MLVERRAVGKVSLTKRWFPEMLGRQGGAEWGYWFLKWKVRENVHMAKRSALSHIGAVRFLMTCRTGGLARVWTGEPDSSAEGFALKG